ncbi:LapA family protein [Aliiroseovarius crassostreae]|uniref:LapA family protein n=1 Tax=Aliiroseovarius crassostreae TaxID=154981 RepID=A0A9Q9HAL6_9RHOB|nr:LapA family protein [Aliiroseovarius crassostreae]UWP94724.1 LapA family protein [Aliiroseovarius crassostreae]
MRYIRYLFLAALAVCLVTISMANRGMVTLHLLPAELSGFLGFSWSITLPLFIVIFLGIIAGVMIGFVWEYLREHKFRAAGKRTRKERDALIREVKKLKHPKAKPGDDIIALLEEAK